LGKYQERGGMNKKCLTCSEHEKCKDSRTSWFFFIVGLLATIAVRAVTVLMHMNPVYGKLAWYLGVTGFFLFFVYKFKITQARSNLIKKANLVDKVAGRQELAAEDYKLISSLLCAISSNKEKVNYFFIFTLSFVALALALYMDFLK